MPTATPYVSGVIIVSFQPGSEIPDGDLDAHGVPGDPKGPNDLRIARWVGADESALMAIRYGAKPKADIA